MSALVAASHTFATMQLNKCQQCSRWLDEVWRGKEPTRTFLRFMISRLRDTSDSALGDRFEIHEKHAATVSHYNWVPPPEPDGKRRAYYSSSIYDWQELRGSLLAEVCHEGIMDEQSVVQATDAGTIQGWGRFSTSLTLCL